MSGEELGVSEQRKSSSSGLGCLLNERGSEPVLSGEFVDTEAVKDDIMRTCGHLPPAVQAEIYSERVFAEQYGTDTHGEPDRCDD